jgi:alcohol dehydrogenase class IV
LKSPKLLAPKLPQLIIPTTPTTAIVKAGSAVFDCTSKRRLALFDPKTRAQSVFIHPDAVLTAPLDLVVSSSLDTFVLAVEGLTAAGGDPISDALIMHAVRLLSFNLRSQRTHDDPAWRCETILAALLCGQGTDHTGAGIATALGHAIAPYTEAENGIIKAIVLPHALRFNGDAAKTGLEKVAVSLSLKQLASDPLPGVLGAIAAITKGLSIPRRLRDVGVPREVISDVAEHTMGDWWLRGNPRAVQSASELQLVLEAAW